MRYISTRGQAPALAFEDVMLTGLAPEKVKVNTLYLGGGFGIPYFPGEQPLELAPIGAALADIVAEAAARLPQARIVLELGRYLVGEAGIYAEANADESVDFENLHSQLPTTMTGCNSPRKRLESAKCWQVVKRLRSCEGAPDLADSPNNNLIGKLIGYLVTDFIKANIEPA